MQRPPACAALVSTVLFPFQMMSIEGSYVGTLQDLKELLELGNAGKIPPIPIEPLAEVRHGLRPRLAPQGEKIHP